MADDTEPSASRGQRPPRRVAYVKPRAAPGQLAAGTVLNNTHRIEGLLAVGGMGEVYRATNLASGDAVAIKTMRTDAVRDAKIQELFRREGSALRKLRDPAIVAYEGSFIAEAGLPYLAMEFVDGPSLAQVVRDRPLSVDEVRRLRDRVAKGLAHAHEQGVIHRDLSPQNIILPSGKLDQAKVIDFGIAKLQGDLPTMVGKSFAGKVAFAAPEQFGLFGHAIDGRTDIYSLGLVLACAATGRALDMGDSLTSAVAARWHVPDLTGLPEELRAEIGMLLEPDPANRPQSMRAVIAGTAPPPRTRAAHAARPTARPTTRIAAAIGLGLAVIAIAALLVWKPWAPDRRALELAHWQTIQASADAAVFRDYERRAQQGEFPGTFRAAAQARIAAIEEQRRQAAEAERRAEAERQRLAAEAAERERQEAAERQRQRRGVMPIAGVYPAARAVFRDRKADGDDCPECPELVVIPAGGYTIGVSDAEEQREGVPQERRGRARPQTEMRIAQGFALGRLAVTVGEYAAFVRATGRTQPPGCNVYRQSAASHNWGWERDASADWHEPGFAQSDRHPAVCVNWEDAQAYAHWLSDLTAQTYRLASEAEWEYAARAGTRTARWWGDRPQDACTNANVTDRQTTEQFRWPLTPQDTHNCDDGAIYTAEGGRYQANDFALRDMLGNVWQWVEDCWNPSYAGRPADQRAWLSGDCSQRVVRGGSWISNAWAVRSGSRSPIPAQERYFFAGLRIARAIAP